MSKQSLELEAFVRAASPDTLRILHCDGAWSARSGPNVLLRPDGSTRFTDLVELLGVLASVGIRCTVIEWDGLEARPPTTAAAPASHELHH